MENVYDLVRRIDELLGAYRKSRDLDEVAERMSSTLSDLAQTLEYVSASLRELSRGFGSRHGEDLCRHAFSVRDEIEIKRADGSVERGVVVVCNICGEASTWTADRVDNGIYRG